MVVEGISPGDIRIVQAALDTGSSYTIIPVEIAVSLGYDPAISKKRVRIITGSGVEYAPCIEVKSLTTIGEKIENIEVLCHNLPEEAKVDGLPGINFLSNFDFEVKYSTGTIIINKIK